VLLRDRAEGSPVRGAGVGENDVDAPVFPADLGVDPVQVRGLVTSPSIAVTAVPMDAAAASSSRLRRPVM
jgi:hypothetical protein